MFSLRFDLKDVRHLASRYPLEYDLRVEKLIAPQVRKQKYFTQAQLVEVCRWRTPRSASRVKSNPEDLILTITQTALSTPDERLRIKALTLLKGVSWPAASVLLHFGHVDAYPILDAHELWALGAEAPSEFEFDFWWEYTQFCRELARKARVSMRVLDRALWVYGEEGSW